VEEFIFLDLLGLSFEGRFGMEVLVLGWKLFCFGKGFGIYLRTYFF
jgi:hypothetical protein